MTFAEILPEIVKKPELLESYTLQALDNPNLSQETIGRFPLRKDGDEEHYVIRFGHWFFHVPTRDLIRINETEVMPSLQ